MSEDDAADLDGAALRLTAAEVRRLLELYQAGVLQLVLGVSSGPEPVRAFQVVRATRGARQ